MGASQSQPARGAQAERIDPTAPHTSTSSPSSTRRLPFGRRLSSFLRPDTHIKRERSNSVHPSPGRPLSKRRRVEPDDDVPRPPGLINDDEDDDDDVSALSSLPTPASSSGASAMLASPMGFASSSSLQPPRAAPAPLPLRSAATTAALAGPSRTPMTPATPATPAHLQSYPHDTPSPTDEILAEQLRSISTIRDALGPDWTPAAASGTSVIPAPVDRLLARFRRRDRSGGASESAASSASASAAATLRDRGSERVGHFRGREAPTPPLSSSTSSTSASATTAARSMSHRLSAIMGFAAPGGAGSGGGDASEGGLAEQPNQQQSPPLAVPPAAAAAQPTTEQAAPAGDESGRIPVGAVLVIQGLAQTHANLEEEDMPTANGARRRRASEGANSRPRIDMPRLDQQARMIGNLLTVAAAATATTLLSPESLAATPSRSTAQSAMQNIIERLRPQRHRPSQSVESTLGDYLRTVLRDNRRFAEAVAGDATSANVPAEFQDFLHSLQEDLIQAVRAYAAPDEDAEELAQDEPMDVSPPVTATETPASASVTDGDGTSIPSFYHQRNQNLPGTTQRSLGVSGGTDGTPRRLNFFRAHLFPPVRADGGGAEGDDDQNTVVPSIFVGVRSVSHDPALTTEDLVGHPGFPFLDGQAPEEHQHDAAGQQPQTDTGATTAAGIPEDEPLFDRDLERELRDAAAASSSTGLPSGAASTIPAPQRRTLRDRVLERLTPRRESRTQHAALHSYIIYVVGGNYPRSHPVLAIPSLVSGAPLTAEDLALVSELLGPAKPPTVTADEIGRSGLAVVLGAEMAAYVSTGDVLEGSLERCMICLGDYEAEDPCRVLKCRHAFHKECVDHWLSEGRNSCPTCRTEAVDKSALPKAPAGAEANATAVDAQMPPSGLGAMF